MVVVVMMVMDMTGVVETMVELELARPEIGALLAGAYCIRYNRKMPPRCSPQRAGRGNE